MMHTLPRASQPLTTKSHVAPDVSSKAAEDAVPISSSRDKLLIITRVPPRWNTPDYYRDLPRVG